MNVLFEISSKQVYLSEHKLLPAYILTLKDKKFRYYIELNFFTNLIQCILHYAMPHLNINSQF